MIKRKKVDGQRRKADDDGKRRDNGHGKGLEERSVLGDKNRHNQRTLKNRYPINKAYKCRRSDQTCVLILISFNRSRTSSIIDTKFDQFGSADAWSRVESLQIGDGFYKAQQ